MTTANEENKMSEKKRYKLSPAFLNNPDLGRHTDGPGGNGLSVLVKPTTTQGLLSVTFSQRIRIDGKYTNLGLGSYPQVLLREARQRAKENMQAVEEGRHPRSSDFPIFRQAVEAFIQFNAHKWREGSRSRQDWESSFENHVYPYIGEKKIHTITTIDILTFWDPLWKTKPQTAARVMQRIGAVMRWAQERGFIKADPTPKTRHRPPPPTRMRHLGHLEVAEAVEIVEESNSYVMAVAALKFTFLTVARSGEVRRATWDEIGKATWDEIEKDIWTKPAAHVKSGEKHNVPLSHQAKRVLDEAAEETRRRTGLIFPSFRGKIMSSSSLSNLLRKNGIDAHVHGIRSTFTDWATDTGKDYEQIELSLAHVVRNPYRRSDLLKGRAQLMQEWADCIGI